MEHRTISGASHSLAYRVGVRNSFLLATLGRILHKQIAIPTIDDCQEKRSAPKTKVPNKTIGNSGDSRLYCCFGNCLSRAKHNNLPPSTRRRLTPSPGTRSIKEAYNTEARMVRLVNLVHGWQWRLACLRFAQQDVSSNQSRHPNSTS